ncbi:hypothetical protein GCM10010495_08830 [Kitasatospora herbaricolor]|uniref:DUF5819 family protein n=1 Tax=Kitasatospora herbaricolor TaxID=68217 RepID=UPI00174BDAA6|nr:DUF5819 family protein [Kitasatospora herbaricolor]MDQ0309679.1 hypothetical protein [Kitasatospora herbaricolor]GGV00266.1 hypothetical protein GCM10010495_08830 [Kitasatospora herbaricolor]
MARTIADGPGHTGERPGPVPGEPDTAPLPVRSTPALVVLCLAGALLLGATGVFLGAVFLHVAPANALSREYRHQVDAIVYPEFEQNWKLFAPNPLQQNVRLDARVRTVVDGGATREHDWLGLTAQDIAAIRGNPAPSHADQNMLRRAWDFYDGSHAGPDGTLTNPRGKLAEQYLKRIALQRIGRTADGERILEIQFRVTGVPVAPPGWAGESPPVTAPARELPWWPVNDEDYRGLA